MKGWSAFLEEAPERVVEVIEDGPIALEEYSAGKLTNRDKKMGLVKYKGGHGHVKMKHAKRGVVYFDPQFCYPDFVPIAIPDEVMERHADENVQSVFKNL